MGVLAKLFVKDKLHNAKNITIHNCIRGKYYREVCKVKYDGNDLGQELINNNLAQPYFGGKKLNVNWCK